MGRRAAWWVVVGIAVPLLCCGGGVVQTLRWQAQCEQKIEDIRKVVRTDRELIRAELAPLGPVDEVHWVVAPNRHCDVLLPVPGTERDEQYGVVEVGSARAGEMVARYQEWRTFESGYTEFDMDGRLAQYLPLAASWQSSGQFDAQFVGGRSGERARYYIDVESGTVVFASYADRVGSG